MFFLLLFYRLEYPMLFYKRDITNVINGDLLRHKLSLKTHSLFRNKHINPEINADISYVKDRMPNWHELTMVLLIKW